MPRKRYDAGLPAGTLEQVNYNIEAQRPGGTSRLQRAITVDAAANSHQHAGCVAYVAGRHGDADTDPAGNTLLCFESDYRSRQAVVHKVSWQVSGDVGTNSDFAEWRCPPG